MYIRKILLFLLISVFLWGKNSEKNYSIVYPLYIPQNSNFEVSLITSNKFSQANYFDLYILPDSKINLNKAELKFSDENIKLTYSASIFELNDEQALKTTINLSDAGITPGAFFQLLFNFRSENTLSSSVRFAGVFRQDDKILGYLNSGESLVRNSTASADDKTIRADFRFFKPQKNAGRLLQIGKQSQFEMTLNNNVKNLLTEFWVKFNDPDIHLLNVESTLHPEFNLEIITNEFQMLTVNSEKQTGYLSPYFTSKKAWYHIAALFSNDKSSVSLFCDDYLFASFNLPVYINPGELKFKFISNDDGKTYQLDLLRFINFNNSIETSLNNSNYLNFIADSSKVITQFKFDSNDEFSSDKNIAGLITDNLQFVKSDAPIVARAPELNINLLSNSYELEWNGGDFKQADSYILEKSLDNSAYISVFTIQADNINEKTYSYLDEKDAKSDVIFYRIRQVNKDGSTVYSSQVKVGQGILEPFTLEQNYPNPFNPKTSIDIELLEDTEVEISVFNLEGKEVVKLQKGYLTKGIHKFTFDASELPSGVYLYKVSTPGYSQTKKMILTK